MKWFQLLILVSIALSCASKDKRPLTTVEYVDVPRYAGRWYAVAALPQSYTEECIAQMADYKVIDKKRLSLVNTCIKNKGQDDIKGEATIANTGTNAELDVRFDNFFTKLFRVVGDYNIMKLDEDYQYVLVGSRNREGLWIMSRQPSMPEQIYRQYVKEAAEQGFNVNQLELSKF